MADLDVLSLWARALFGRRDASAVHFLHPTPDDANLCSASAEALNPAPNL